MRFSVSELQKADEFRTNIVKHSQSMQNSKMTYRVVMLGGKVNGIVRWFLSPRLYLKTPFEKTYYSNQSNISDMTLRLENFKK